MSGSTLLLLLAIFVAGAAAGSDCSYGFSESPDSQVRGGVLQPEIKTLDLCKDMCVRSEDCVSIDYRITDDSCFKITFNAVMSPKPGIIHYSLDTVQCGECRTVFVEKMGTSIPGGRLKQKLNTLAACKAGCGTDPDCYGCDFRQRDSKCWLLTNPADPVPNFQVNHYAKKEKCGDCVFHYFTNRAAPGASPIDVQPTLDQASCIDLCCANDKCVAAVFDKVGRKCLQYDRPAIGNEENPETNYLEKQA